MKPIFWLAYSVLIAIMILEVFVHKGFMGGML